MFTLGVWLAGSTLVALVVGHWITYTNGLMSVAAFVAVRPFAPSLPRLRLAGARSPQSWCMTQ
jgi:hypothetical protein